MKTLAKCFDWFMCAFAALTATVAYLLWCAAIWSL